MNNIGINDVTIGFDFNAAEEYMNNLNEVLINQTKEKLGDIAGIKGALEAGWQGTSEENFVKNLEGSIAKVSMTMSELEQALRGQFAAISESWQEQDAEMVPLDN